MPTIAQIQSQASTPLSSLEREIVRHIIGINGRTTSSVYIDSEERFTLLAAEQNQLMRALMGEHELIDNTTVAIAGGNDGLNVSFNRDRELIAQQLRRILYPSLLHDPEETGVGGVPTITFVGASYCNGSSEYD